MTPFYFGPIAYAAYCEAVTFKTGAAMPAWDALTDDQRHAWEAAGDAAAARRTEDAKRDG